MSTAKGAVKGAAKGFAGAMAGGLIGQGLGAAYDYFKGPQTADIGAPDPVRTIGPGNPEAPDYETAAANGAETLGPKGIDTFNQNAGATDASGNIISGREDWAFNPNSSVDQARTFVKQVGGTFGVGGDNVFNAYETAARNAFGGQSGAVKGLANLVNNLKNAGDTQTLTKLFNKELDVSEVINMIKNAGVVNSSFEYKGDSQLLWEAYQDITRY